jgi:hypothetical protein
MRIEVRFGHERLLNPVERSAEILFGLIMAVTVLGSLSSLAQGRPARC